MAQPLLQQGWQFNCLESNSIHAWKNKYDACTKEHSKRQTEDALVIIRLDATATVSFDTGLGRLELQHSSI
jgi:hypothetical protein